MKDKINATLPTLRAGLRAALFLLKLTTLFVLALIGWKIFAGKVPPAVAYGLSFIFAMLGGFVVDGVLDKILPLAMTRASTTDKNERRFKIAITCLSLVLLIISGTLSWWAMPELSEVAIGKDAPKTDSTLAEIQEFRAGFLAEIQGKESELADAKRTERARLREAEKRGRSLVAAAIASGPNRWQELYREKNGWFLKQRGDIGKYLKRINDAEAQAVALVEKERGLAESIRAEKAGIESSRGAAIDSISTAFTGIAVAQAQRHERRLANMTNVLLICDVAWMFLALFLSWLIGLVDGHEFRTENRNMFGVLFEVADDREQGALAAIEWRLKRKKKYPTEPTEKREPAPTERPTEPTEIIPARTDGTDDATLRRVLHLVESQGQILHGLTVDVERLKEPTEHRPMDAIPSEKPTERKPTETRRKTRRKIARSSSDGNKVCPNCGNNFVGKTKRAKYCSDACRKSWNEKKNRKK